MCDATPVTLQPRIGSNELVYRVPGDCAQYGVLYQVLLDHIERVIGRQA